MDVMIGVDPHKASVTATAVGGDRRRIATVRVATTAEGRQALLRWAAKWPQRTWAVEGANGLGHPLAQHLVARGEQVLDVPAKLTARVRLLSQGHNRKTDADDSHAIAVAALDSDRLNPVTVDSAPMMLRLLTDRRDELVHQRTRTLNQIHRLLSELIPGGCAGKLTGTRARRILSRIRTRTEVARARRRIVADLVEDAIRLERRIKAMDRDIEEAMGTSSTLPAIYGCGYVTAARILGHVRDVTRFPSRAHFASYTGTAPIATSSGEVVRHRLSRAGDRQLNQALHLIALVQLRDDTPSRAYFRRKLAEGKSSREALRCVKRRVSDQVYRVMSADERSAVQPVSTAAT